VLNKFGLGMLSIYGQFRNKITFYPVTEGAYVNTKIGTGKRLTCEPNLAEEYHSTVGFPQSIR
jgi:hypothetical protein